MHERPQPERTPNNPKRAEHWCATGVEGIHACQAGNGNQVNLAGNRCSNRPAGQTSSFLTPGITQITKFTFLTLPEGSCFISGGRNSAQKNILKLSNQKRSVITSNLMPNSFPGSPYPTKLCEMLPQLTSLSPGLTGVLCQRTEMEPML